MPHPINMEGYLANPVGKGSANVARRSFIRRDLETRYLLMTKQSGKLFSIQNAYVDKAGNYILHLRVPSEYYYKEGLMYDVVLQYLTNSRRKVDETLASYDIRMYSNSPAFMFTYAYVYNQDDNLVPFLKNKLSSKALTQAPVVRNPNQSYGYEKSVYFAILYVRDNPRLISAAIKKASHLNILDVSRGIMSSVQKKKAYDSAKKKHLASEKKKGTIERFVDDTTTKARKLTSNAKSRTSMNKSFRSVASKSTIVNMKKSRKIEMNPRKRKKRK